MLRTRYFGLLRPARRVHPGRHYPRRSYSDDVVVNLLGRLDTPVPQAVPDVVQRVTLFGVHHPVSDTVAEGVGCNVAGLITGAVDQVRLDASLLGNLRDRVADALSSDPVARPRGKQRWRVLPPAIQVRRQQPCNV